MTTAYLERLKARIARCGALCVGLDPHPGLLKAWDLPVDAQGAERLALATVEALADRVACFKPQSAFFEVWGAAGVHVLERVIAEAQSTGALVIVDAKRGDIGSTMTAYAEAYLGDGPLAGDAVTLSPYLGFESLAPAFDLAEATGRGVYVLARTSNPEGGTIQLATTSAGPSVVQSLIDAATARNTQSGVGAVGLVVGGTHASSGADLDRFAGSLLVPGIGTQGGTMAGLRQLVGNSAATVLPSVSREILQAGPQPQGLQGQVDRLLAAAR
jgi:orotidine-5'-phosphate decarboxylase